MPNPIIPPPKPYDPVPHFKRWAAKFQAGTYNPDGTALVSIAQEIKQHMNQVFKNLSKGVCKKVTISRSADLKDWDSIRAEWFHTAGGFSMSNIRKLAEADPDRITIQFDLRPGEEFGWVLPK